MVMETYYRKRFKRASQLTQMCAEQGDMQSPVLGRHHHVPRPPSSDHNHSTPLLLKVGCVYEIDQNHLPKRTPTPFRSIRVAMVCEKTEMNVSVRYPSKESLRAFFSYSKMETHPTLDEKFVMGTELAEKVLVKLVPAEIVSELKNFEDFWLLSSDSLMGDCLSEALKGNGMVSWGIRRQVKYLGRHREINDDKKASSSFISGSDNEAEIEKSENEEEDDGNEEVKEEEDVDKEEEDDEDENEEDEEDDEEEKEEKIMVTGDSKRKRYTFRNLSKKKPKVGIEKKKKTQTKRKNKARYSDAIVLRNPKDRWSSQRYKLAEKNLLEVMKVKGSTAQKPILRPQLREEARKKIGDTGLLDHLLKHLAGKIAPGGEQRFRRRHNAEGAMEYWLESADLVNVRLKAGISDPYWVPPPGWKPGDSPTQDPICAKELKILKHELENIKRDMDLRATKKHLEEEVQRLREVNEIYTKRRQEENQAITITSSSSEISQKLEQLATLMVSSKSDHLGMPLCTLEKYKEQLLGISDFVKEIEVNIGKLTSKVEQIAKLDSTLIIPDKEKKQETEKPKTIQHEVQAFNASDQETEKTAAAEQKAAKIQRLKSGFKLCKPQGTFLWPGMNKNDMVWVQVDVPTPPSVSSSTALAPPPLPYIGGPYRLPKPPVKPLAERGGLTVTVSTASNNNPSGARNYSTTTMINLNDAPTISTTMSFKPRNGMNCDQKENNGCCSSSSSASNFHSRQVENWLALSSVKSVSDGVSRHG